MEQYILPPEEGPKPSNSIILTGYSLNEIPKWVTNLKTKEIVYIDSWKILMPPISKDYGLVQRLGSVNIDNEKFKGIFLVNTLAPIKKKEAPKDCEEIKKVISNFGKIMQVYMQRTVRKKQIMVGMIMVKPPREIEGKLELFVKSGAPEFELIKDY